MLALLATALVVTALAAFLCARGIGRLSAGRARPRRGTPAHVFDPGRERRAEQRARQLLRSCVNESEWAMYRDLGFIRVPGRGIPDASDAGQPPYAYLVYPHKPLVAYEPGTGRLLSEYCVQFPDVQGGAPVRLPASDDVLAKWMALTSDESRLIGRANMHLVGRQHDPAHVRRDIWRLAEWERRNGAERGSRSRAA